MFQFAVGVVKLTCEFSKTWFGGHEFDYSKQKKRYGLHCWILRLM